MKARFRLGSPRMPQLTLRTGHAEDGLNADAEWRVIPYVIPSAARNRSHHDRGRSLYREDRDSSPDGSE